MNDDYSYPFSSRSLKNYLRQIARYPLLTPGEERELGRRIQKGDREALRKLIESNLRFVVSYVKKYQGMGLPLLDLIHEGNLGLIEAAKRYDPQKNVKFISYAVWWIRQAIINALTQNSRIYNLPQKVSDQISEMKKVKAELKKRLGREPTRQEVAKEMRLSPHEIEDMEILDERNVSLSDPYYNEDIEFEDRVEDQMAPSVEYQIIKNSIEKQVREMVDELSEKEATVLKLRFGLDDDRPHTLQEIGNKLNLTRERIRQIEKKAMRKLAQSHKLQQLRGFLN
ncbi:MAG: hypothetical protein B5M54_10055 [Candidatus Aminicenantes bacterium 4484_214]|nr:MAG: hypothetical protein B5M54_10055 [Candidatus Aminicenantes bacterium 4484_214]